MAGLEVRHGHPDVGRQGDLAGGFGAERGAAWAAWTPAPTPALGKLFGHGVLVQAHPHLLWEDRCLTGPPPWGSRPSRQRGHPDCVAAILDALLIPAGQVGMIMAGFVPISGYKRSKNQSGRADLNRRPLDPQECIPEAMAFVDICLRRSGGA